MLKQSIFDFIWGVIKRYWAYLPAFLLDPLDLYSKYIKPRLPVEYQVDIEIPDWAFWCVLGAGLFLAALMTYYDLKKRHTRNPKTTKKLKDFYTKSGDLLGVRVTDDDELEKFMADTLCWYNNTSNYIKENMEPSSLEKFKQTSSSSFNFHVMESTSINEVHQKRIIDLRNSHKNLADIINSQEWK